MSTDFDGPPLVAGSILGTRHFNLTTTGILRGPTSTYHWYPGENIAEHVDYWWSMPNFFMEGNPRDPNHKIAQRNCRCGFYAYYDYRNSDYGRSGGNVPAIIEAYGRVSVGPLGFRAEKAKIIAVAVDLSGDRAPWIGEEAVGYLRQRYPEVELHGSAKAMYRDHPTPRPDIAPEPVDREDRQVTWGSGGGGGFTTVGTTVYFSIPPGFSFTAAEDPKPESTIEVKRIETDHGSYLRPGQKQPPAGWSQVSPGVHRYVPREGQR